MERKKRREIALVVLAIALIGTAVWRVRSADSPAPTAQAPSSAPAPRASGQPAPDPSALAAVNLPALQAERPEPQDGNRNPFRFKPRPAPPLPGQGTGPARGAQQASPIPAGPIEPPQPPPIPLKFIGLADGRDSKVGRVAILSDARGVYYGREGEAIEGRYRILKIGVESIDLAYLDGRGRQTIRLTGQ